MDFGALPPEINSARIYAGPGSGPLMAAAAAWNSLAAELASAASSYQSVISSLTSEAWTGPSAAAMATAAAPYVAWLHTTAAAAEHAAGQAAASAAAYQTAFAMTVPPPVIAANRAQLAALVATNFLGQNTPAIMATEAHYAEMWAQDAAAMYGYASSSASAGILQPLAPPAPNTNPGGLAGQVAATATAGTQTELSQLVAGLPNAVQGLASPLAGSASASGGCKRLSVRFHQLHPEHRDLERDPDLHGGSGQHRGLEHVRRHRERHQFCRSRAGRSQWHRRSCRPGRPYFKRRRIDAGRPDRPGALRRGTGVSGRGPSRHRRQVVGADHLVGGHLGWRHRGRIPRFRLDQRRRGNLAGGGHAGRHALGGLRQPRGRRLRGSSLRLQTDRGNSPSGRRLTIKRRKREKICNLSEATGSTPGRTLSIRLLRRSNL
ncbi:hypothetical protein MHEC_11300 [Mycobacterium heckeshornense]|uniref:PPE domain-containing protein n=1 Tax=Mycobacterium heckeshornense TaxID=110505 RepID=A0A7R7JEV0_9MYCO|nr:hypothetical protein MHEC_11300 [Mycobacterium heckeshornense]